MPTYNQTGGPEGKGHVTFDRLLSQFLDAGPRTLNIATNGGLTIVTVMRFTGDIGNWERILDLGSEVHDNNLLLSREGTSTRLKFDIYNGRDRILDGSFDNVIVQNTWLTVVARYRVSTRKYLLTVNNADQAGDARGDVTDRWVSKTYLGRSHLSDDYLNGDISGVFVVDEYLDKETTSAIADAIASEQPVTPPSVPVSPVNDHSALADADHDGIPDDYEDEHGLNKLSATDGRADPDHDGLTNWHEYLLGTDPHIADDRTALIVVPKGQVFSPLESRTSFQKLQEEYLDALINPPSPDPEPPPSGP